MKIYNQLISIEVDSGYAADFRRLVLDHRMGLQLALQSKDPTNIKERTEDAKDLLRMWGVKRL